MGCDASWDRLLSWLAVHQIYPTMCRVTHMEYKLVMLIMTSIKNDITKLNKMMKKDRCKNYATKPNKMMKKVGCKKWMDKDKCAVNSSLPTTVPSMVLTSSNEIVAVDSTKNNAKSVLE